MNRDLTTMRALLGRRAMGQRRVVICGLARNVASVLPATIRGIERLGETFADYRVVIYENDSADRTAAVLQDWSGANHRVACLSERRGDPVNRPIRCRRRATRMATYRNYYLDYIRQHYIDFDFAIVIDTDLGSAWDECGIATTFASSNWDFVGSYGVIYRYATGVYTPMHYDAWAYRTWGSDAPVSTKVANRFTPAPQEGLIPVNSCFGGLGIYRLNSLLSSRYSGEDCEHVPLHRRMRQQGFDRIYMNSEQLTFYGVKRSVSACRWRKVGSKVRRIVREFGEISGVGRSAIARTS